MDLRLIMVRLPQPERERLACVKLRKRNYTGHNLRTGSYCIPLHRVDMPDNNKESSADTELAVPHLRFQCVYGTGCCGVRECSFIGVGEKT